MDIKKCLYCGKEIDKSKLGYPIDVKAWNKRNFCSIECRKKGLVYLKDRKRGKLFLKGNIPHNKGIKTSVIHLNNTTWAKELRKKPDYYVSELRENAIRHKERDYYHRNPNRREQIRNYKEDIDKRVGKPKRAMWSIEDELYLTDNVAKISAEDMAIFLGRSFSSICHKLSRLKLTRYNKWNDREHNSNPIQ
jgi:hypothetical protein